jgi:hypothetical protein
MKTAYEHDMTATFGASYMPKNVVRENHTSAGLGASNQPDGAFHEQRATAYRTGADAAQHHFGIKRSSLTQPGTPKTNQNADVPKKPKPSNIPDSGTGYSTSGAQYGADLRR